MCILSEYLCICIYCLNIYVYVFILSVYLCMCLCCLYIYVYVYIVCIFMYMYILSVYIYSVGRSNFDRGLPTLIMLIQKETEKLKLNCHVKIE